MKTIRINLYCVSKRALERAVAVLQGGGVVVFPTDTAYGLAADPSIPGAIDRICRIKGRSKQKQLPFVASGQDQVRANFRLNKKILGLIGKFWPGPLTVVLKGKAGSPFSVWPDAAVRVPASVWARALPAALGRPVTSTSANFSGDPNCYSAAAVRRSFRGRADRPDLVLDAGNLPERPPSTIVRVVGKDVLVLRSGPVAV
ncbi:threonylcarbamoyl-AMP synthase [Candidatus Uhrbacteria bacterium]|nr:threonylcarbamoyl-AMP synthase [Candidatus Uhrbacteria bacterium]